MSVIGYAAFCQLKTVTLEHLASGVGQDVVEFQFSIRQVLMLTFVSSCLLGIIRAARETEAAFLLGGGLICLLVVVSGPISCWAALGRSRPLIPGLLTLVASLLLGILATLMFGEVPAVTYLAMVGASGVQTVVILVSFLVLRSAGYRLYSP